MSVEGYLVLASADSARLKSIAAGLWPQLARAGWRRRMTRPFLHVYAPSTTRLEVAEAFDAHGVLIGQVFDRSGAALSTRERAIFAGSDLDDHRAQGIVRNLWGRYVLIRQGSDGVAVLRDPSGALEAVCWRKGPVTVIAPDAPTALDTLLPDEVAIDWDGVTRLLHSGGRFRHLVPLHGLSPVAPGSLVTVGRDAIRSRQIWRPAEIYRDGRSKSGPDLRTVVDQSVRALAGDRQWVVEISGGLDSAIVVAALDESQRARTSAWVNYFADDPEGDERPFARSVLERFGGRLTEVHREGLALSPERLRETAIGFRPSINDLDVAYNDDMDAKIIASGAWGSLTGQGGDAVFFQMPSFLVALDEVFENGLRARPAVVHDIARWTGRSLWPASWLKALSDHRRAREGWEHPWLGDLKSVPPAKALQISALVNCQTFHGVAGRSRHGPSVHPLLSQPVMEAGLAWSSVDLTRGGRDRAAARIAYSDALPEMILERRSKGELSAFYGRAVVANLDFLRSYLLEGELAQACLLDQGLERAMTREALVWHGGAPRLLSLALLEAWLRRWRERIPAARV